jgi:hypothetical protein
VWFSPATFARSSSPSSVHRHGSTCSDFARWVPARALAQSRTNLKASSQVDCATPRGAARLPRPGNHHAPSTERSAAGRR